MSLLRRTAAPLAALVAALAVAPVAAVAQGHASDPANDFLPTYTGTQTPDLDVLDVWFSLDGNGFHLRSRQAGAIDPASGHLFVWGVNRGQGAAGFPAIAPGVLFDAILAINPGAATNSVRDLRTGIATPLPVGAVSFAGSFLQIDVPIDLLPSTGFALGAYTANLWPRGNGAGTAAITDFAPDNSNVTVQTTPEPATFMLLAPALLAVGAVVRRRRAVS